jgi:hemin uptake protein HemP
VSRRMMSCAKHITTITKAQSPGDVSVNEITSAELLGLGGTLIINHDGQRYTLRQTSKGKLILTK